MRRYGMFLGLALLLISGCKRTSTSVEPVSEDPAALATALRAQIPAAAGLSNEEFAAATTNPQGNLGAYGNQPLTLVLWLLHPKEHKGEFRYLTPSDPDLATLSTALGASRASGYHTYLQPQAITSLSCSENGDKATGTLTFVAAGLYEGKVEFVAERVAGQWQVTEFVLPGGTTKRTADGNWRWTAKRRR